MARGILSFVGRGDELAALTGALEDARDGRGGTWLLAGEPGIGKSRLAEEAARIAAAEGFGVVWGRCWEAGGAPELWPWVQALRALARDRGAGAIGPGARRQLAPVVPELGDGTAPPDGGRFELLDAFTTAICDLAAAAPVLIVLDDLHAADHASLALLDFASRPLRSARALVIGTFRQRDARRGPHAGLFSRLAQDARTIALGPLDPGAVTEYLGAATRVDDTAGLAGALHRRTEGHPLFMVELVRLIASRPSISAEALDRAELPPGLEHALRDHAAALSAGARAVVEMAAVMGREACAADLAAMFGEVLDRVSGALDEACDLSLMLPIAPGRYRFAHILVRDVIVRDLDAARRASLHGELAGGLERAGDASWSEIAHHYAAAGPARRDDALRALARAGESACARLAFEDAAAHYERALSLLDAAADPRARAELLIGLCRAQVGAGQLGEGGASARAAVAVARELDDAELLAGAALELGSTLVFGRIDAELVELLRESLRALPPGASPCRALVQARLAAALQPSVEPWEPMRLAREAIAMARELGDDATLLATLRTGCSAMVDLAPPAARLELNREHARLAAATGALHDALRAQTRMIFDCFELGDRLGADAAVRAAAALIEQIDQPSVRWQLHAMDAMRALWDGALEAALEACERAAAVGATSGNPNARTSTVYQRQRILRMLGRADELAAGAEELRGLFDAPAMRDLVAVDIASQRVCAGRPVTVDASVLSTGFDRADRTILEPLAELALATGDRALAERIRERVAGEREQLVSGGVLGMAWYGPVYRVLALCALTLGERDVAADCFERGIERVRCLGGEPVAAWMRAELGELRATMGDAAAARRELQAALHAAESMAMQSVAGRARRALDTLGEASASAPASREAFALEPEGDVWRVSRGGASFRVKDSKGMRFLATLVAEPGRDVHVLDLTSPSMRSAVDTDAGEALDDAARDAYRQRIAALRAELDEAERWNDPARAEAARAELEMLTDELARGYGLGGRARRVGSNAERARVNVQRRIRDAIKRIAAHDDALARHLERSITTGMQCRYDPE